MEGKVTMMIHMHIDNRIMVQCSQQTTKVKPWTQLILRKIYLVHKQQIRGFKVEVEWVERILKKWGKEKI